MSASSVAEAMPRGRRAVHQRLGVREVVRVAAFDRVRRERERRAGKSDERHAAGELLLDLPDRLEHVRQRFARLERAAADRGRLRAHRVLDRRAFALDEVEADAHRLERQQQIGKQDRGVDVDPPHRLQRDFGGEIGRSAEIEQRIALAQRAVLAHVPAGLAHEPDRRRVDRLPAAGAEESANRRRSVGHLEKVAGEADQVFEPQRLELELGAELPQLVETRVVEEIVAGDDRDRACRAVRRAARRRRRNRARRPAACAGRE